MDDEGGLVGGEGRGQGSAREDIARDVGEVRSWDVRDRDAGRGSLVVGEEGPGRVCCV